MFSISHLSRITLSSTFRHHLLPTVFASSKSTSSTIKKIKYLEALLYKTTSISGCSWTGGMSVDKKILLPEVGQLISFSSWNNTYTYKIQSAAGSTEMDLFHSKQKMYSTRERSEEITTEAIEQAKFSAAKFNQISELNEKVKLQESRLQEIIKETKADKQKLNNLYMDLLSHFSDT